MKYDPIEYRIVPSLGCDGGIRIEGNVMRRLEPKNPDPVMTIQSDVDEVLLSDEKLRAIHRLIDKVGFSDWDSEYSIDASDGQDWHITVGEKSVKIYLEGPKGLDELAEMFDDLMEEVGAFVWSGI